MKKAFMTLAACLSAMLMSADITVAQCSDCESGGGAAVASYGGGGGGVGSHVRGKLGRIKNALSINWLNPGYTGGSGVVGADGMTQTVDGANTHPLATLKRGLNDPYSPHPFYAYSTQGVRAGHTHQWNQQQMGSGAWHGNNNYWKYERPTALVVPPTAGFQTSYNWGVGNTRSTPIHHQFGSGNAGMIGGGGGEGGGFSNTPYWPSSTDEFGVYPVRGPWGR